MSFKRIFSYLLFLGILILSEGCSIYGHYTTAPQSGRISFAGYDLVLTRNQTFIIRSWTDNFSNRSDALGNRIWDKNNYRGFGTFTHNNDTLSLSFLNEDSLRIHINKSIKQDTALYEIVIFNEIGKTITPWLITKEGNATNQYISWTPDNLYSIKIPESAKPQSIIIDDIGIFLENPKIQLSDLKPGKYIIKRKTYAGYYAKGETTKLYCKRTFTGIRRGPKKRWLAKKYKIEWINKLYPN